MTNKQTELMRQTMQILFRTRKEFQSDMGFAVAILSAVFSVNQSQELTEAEFMDEFLKTLEAHKGEPC